MSLNNCYNKQSPSSGSKLRCYTCLSLDRNLKPLKARDLFAMLCPEMFRQAKPNAQYLICWECDNMTVKIKQFQARLEMAHFKLKLSLRGVNNIVESLSNLKKTRTEIINLPSQSIQILAQKDFTSPLPKSLLPTSLLSTSLLSTSSSATSLLPTSSPTEPIKLENLKAEFEEVEEECDSGDFDEMIQPTVITQDFSGESTDTASETETLKTDDPLMTPMQKKPKNIEKYEKIYDAPLLPHQKNAPDQPPNKKFLLRPQKVFITTPKEQIPLRGFEETVKVTVGVPNSVKGKNSTPILVKNNEGATILVKGNENASILAKGIVPNLKKGEDLILIEQNVTNVPNPSLESKCEQTLGIYGHEEDEALCKIMSIYELNAYRNQKRLHGVFKGARYKCERCIETFTSKKLWDEHNKKHDKSRGTSICDVCEQVFPDESVLNEHYKQHFIVYECLECGFQHNDRVRLSIHIRRIHAEDTFSCRTCDAVLKTYKELRRHRKVHYNRPSCKECKKTFGSLYLLKTHMSSTHRGERVECHLCKKKVRKYCLKAHMKTHNDTRSDSAFCVDCGTFYKSQQNYEMHLKTSLKHNTVEKLDIKCGHCDKYFASKTALRNHFEEIVGINYTCDICKKEFKLKSRLDKHVRFIHEGQKPRIKPKRIFVCEICGKSFTIKQSLEQHMNKHLGRRPYACKDCGATFAYSAALFTHRRLVHKVKRKREMNS